MLLKKGDTGPNVRELQTLLDDNGFWTYPTITEYFGSVTETSVKNFQFSKQIKVDGLVGNTTYSCLEFLSRHQHTTGTNAHSIRYGYKY